MKLMKKPKMRKGLTLSKLKAFSKLKSYREVLSAKDENFFVFIEHF